MAHKLSSNEEDQIKNLFLNGRSIKSVARELGFSKNTVKRILREDGLSCNNLPGLPQLPQDGPVPELEEIDFSLLEKLFEQGRKPGENLDFQTHIRAIADSISREIGIKGTIDKIRLESAITQYIAFRRFYMKSLSCSDKCYAGPFGKSHEKLARAVSSWVDASNKALDQYNRLIRELEFKYNKRVPEFSRNHIVMNNQVAVQVGGKI